MGRPSILHCFTDTPLAAGATFASGWQRIRLEPVAVGTTRLPIANDREQLKGSVVSDQASAANGFQVQQANADDQSDSFIAFQQALVASVPVTFQVSNTAKYVRIELINGVVPQGALSLAAWLTDE